MHFRLLFAFVFATTSDVVVYNIRVEVVDNIPT